MIVQHNTLINNRIIITAPTPCTGLKTEWTSTIETTTHFPVDPGTVVEVTCSDTNAVLEGNSITCITGSIFAFTKEPSCSIPGFDAINIGYANCQFSHFHYNCIINFLFVFCGCGFIVLLCLMRIFQIAPV